MKLGWAAQPYKGEECCRCPPQPLEKLEKEKPQTTLEKLWMGMLMEDTVVERSGVCPMEQSG
jgi:hypothetical protein